MSTILESLRQALAAENLLSKNEQALMNLKLKDIEALVERGEMWGVGYKRFVTVDFKGFPLDPEVQTLDQFLVALIEMGFVEVDRKSGESSTTVGLNSADGAFYVILQESSKSYDKYKVVDVRTFLKPEHILMFALARLNALSNQPKTDQTATD